MSLVGYDRYTARVTYQCRHRLYNNVRLYNELFPADHEALVQARDGARVYKVYETAQTPYQRLLQSGELSKTKQAEMAATYSMLNPVLLLKQNNRNLEQLWRLADRHASSGNQNYEATIRASVTV